MATGQLPEYSVYGVKSLKYSPIEINKNPLIPYIVTCSTTFVR